jgi:hypothetical protein
MAIPEEGDVTQGRLGDVYEPVQPKAAQGSLFEGAQYETGPQEPRPYQRSGDPVSPFAAKGLGKYINRNASGTQFNKPAIRDAIVKGLDAYSTARYYRHAGMGQALRATMGLPQVPHGINAWMYANQKNLQGINPAAEEMEPEHEHWGM